MATDSITVGFTSTEAEFKRAFRSLMLANRALVLFSCVVVIAALVVVVAVSNTAARLCGLAVAVTWVLSLFEFGPSTRWKGTRRLRANKFTSFLMTVSPGE